MKSNRAALIIAVSLAINLAAAVESSAQIGNLWNSGNLTNLAILGSANMDSDPQGELVIRHLIANNQEQIIIFDGLTGNIDWSSDTFYDIDPLYPEHGFITLNQMGLNAYAFWGQISSGELMRIYVVGSGGTGFTSPGGGVEAPEIHILTQNYPNPFNPSTTIQYSVTAPGQIFIKIYNNLGQEVRTVLEEHKQAGEYSIVWDGKDNDGNPLASGAYFYQMRVGDFISAKKMIMLK